MLVLYTLMKIVQLTLGVLFFLLFVRAILSWFPMNEDSWLNRFVCTITEPVILPFRILAERIPFFQGIPVDVGQLFAFLAIMIVQMLLELVPVAV